MERNTIGLMDGETQNKLMEELRREQSIQLYEQLDFQNAVIVNGEVYCGDLCLNDLDRFVWYCEIDQKPGSFDLEVLKTLAREVDVVNKPDRFELGLDKYQSHLLLRDAGVRVPEFALFDARVPKKMAEILENWGAAMLKPRRGGWGKGVTLIDSPERLRDVTGYVCRDSGQSPDNSFFLERYYDNDPERWASLTMINGELTLAYRKVGAKFHDLGDGRLKVQDLDEKGGGVVLADLTPEHKEQAYLADEAMGLGIIGFDMIWTESGPMVVDENTFPGNYTSLYLEMGKKPEKLFADWVLHGI